MRTWIHKRSPSPKNRSRRLTGSTQTNLNSPPETLSLIHQQPSKGMAEVQRIIQSGYPTSEGSLPPAHGVTQNGQTNIKGAFSPTLMGHEIVHLAQQRLGKGRESTASRTTLEAEAHTLGPQIARGERVRVQQAAPANMPLHGVDPDKTYTSTQGLVQNGPDPYVQDALEYHQKWGYNPIQVGSIEAIAKDLAQGDTPLKRIRIVSHASASGLFMEFAQGGGNLVLEGELTALDEDEAVAAAVEPHLQYVNANALAGFRKVFVRDRSELSARLGIKNEGIDSAELKSFFKWLATRKRVQDIPGISTPDRQLLLPAVEQHLSAARSAARALQVPVPTGGGADATAGGEAATQPAFARADLTELESLFGQIGFRWDPLVGNSDNLAKVLKRARATHAAFSERSLEDNQSKVQDRFDTNSVIEIRGCSLGQNENYLKAVQSFFGSSAIAPAVNAPDWYQYFGRVGYSEVEDSEARIKKLWEEKRIRDALVKWSPIFFPGLQLPPKPDWTHLQAYLHAGHALPFNARGRMALVLLKGRSEGQIIDWFSKQQQRIDTVGGIQQQFPGGSIVSEFKTGSIVQWLQKEYGNARSEKVFSFEPGWAGHFKSIPGI